MCGAIALLALLDREARDRDFGVRLEVEFLVVVEKLHLGRVADDDVEGRASAHLGLAAGGIELRQNHLAAAVADLDPRLAAETELEDAAAARRDDGLLGFRGSGRRLLAFRGLGPPTRTLGGRLARLGRPRRLDRGCRADRGRRFAR